MSKKNAFKLLKQQRFLPLFCTQFLGAFNDSLFRNALIILLAFSMTNTYFNPNTLINLCAAIFILPYFLFSAFAGQIADKFEKAKLIRLLKLIELLLSLLSVLGFFLNSLSLLLAALFLLGTQATFFGPIKYSILPQHLKESELLGGNGLIEMGTFIAILLGTLFGTILIAIPNIGIITVSLTMVCVAVIGFVTSLFIPFAKPYAVNLKFDWDIFTETWKIIKDTYKHKTIFYAIIGISWFWLYGSMFITQMANYTKITLNGNEHVVSVLLICFSVGIGLGSVLCEKITNKDLGVGLVPLGAIGMTLFALDLSFAHNTTPETVLDVKAFLMYGHNWRILLDATLMGIFSGFYQVPLYTLIQNRAEPKHRSRVIATNNILNAIFMVLASLIAIVVLNLNFTIPQLFLLTAVLNAIVTFVLFKIIPEFLTQFRIWLRWLLVR